MWTVFSAHISCTVLRRKGRPGGCGISL
jgi:hypothetical protein